MLKAASQYFYLFPPYPLLFSIPNAQPILKNTDNYMFELLSTIAPNMSNSNFNDMMVIIEFIIIITIIYKYYGILILIILIFIIYLLISIERIT